MMFKKSLFLLLMMIAAIASLSYFSLAAKYKYEVAQDYQYAWQNSIHIEAPVHISQGRFQVNAKQRWDTGFIELKITATLLGHFIEPSVEVVANGQVSVLSFERGAQGTRYINLPAINNTHIELKSHYLKIVDQQARLLLFNNPNIQPDAKVLVIAAHPDDAEIAAFGLYSQHNALIVTLTAGEAGPHKYADIYPDVPQHYQAKGKLRVWDSITVPMLGGVLPERAMNLGYFDSTLPRMYAQPNRPVSSLYAGMSNVNAFRQQNLSTLTPVTDGKATWSALVNDLKHIIHHFNPDIIVTPYPALDWHQDHKHATRAVIDALQQLDLQQGQLFLYTNHLSFNNYFPYGAQGELAPIPPDFNQSLYFDSLYSVSPAQPKAKIFALEAMHDLRPDIRWLEPSGAFKLFTKAFTNKFLYRDQSYFRRAVRANELFLVVNFSSLSQKKVINSLNGTEE